MYDNHFRIAGKTADGRERVYMSSGKTVDLTGLDLLKEAEDLGILDIDVTGGPFSGETVQAAIEATRHLHSRLDKEIIAKLLNGGYIAIGSTGLLTERDIRVAMDAISQAEANRDETGMGAHQEIAARESKSVVQR
jgi:hypothetical protein